MRDSERVCVCVSSITTAHLLQCTSHAAFVEYSLCVCLCVCEPTSKTGMIHSALICLMVALPYPLGDKLSRESESILPCCVFISYMTEYV